MIINFPKRVEKIYTGLELEVGFLYKGTNNLIVTPIRGIGGRKFGLYGESGDIMILILQDERGTTYNDFSAYSPTAADITYQLIGKIKELVVE